MTPINDFRRDQRGAAAAEFALLIPVMAALVLGVIHMSMVVYTAVELNDATEWTARCLSVSKNNPSGATTACPSTTAANIQAYGKGRYTGPNISPQFTLVSPSVSCTNGGQVQGAGSYLVALGIVNVTIPITAKACFPYDPPS